ncbi:hypothetical protein HY439_03295 [Candidatus Microgenomates bacterium]|nr:hypothetical protein [Candidatus Microgenomates bacterium]
MARTVKTNEDQNLKAALTYLGFFFTGIFFLLSEKDKFVRFHAMQSTIVFGVLSVLNFVPLLSIFVVPVGLILWVFLMYKAYSGEKYKLPYIGEIAERQV